jgi:hypothetical protein
MKALPSEVRHGTFDAYVRSDCRCSECTTYYKQWQKIHMPKSDGGYPSHLPLDVARYIHMWFIRRHLYGPDANLGTSWKGIQGVSKYIHVDKSYTSRQYQKTGVKMAPVPKHMHPWRRQIIGKGIPCPVPCV